MTMHALIAQAVPPVSELTSFGAAGMMSAMWLWERSMSRTREEQLTATHERIMSDRVQLDALVSVVQQSTQAMTKLTALIEQRDLVAQVRKENS